MKGLSRSIIASVSRIRSTSPLWWFPATARRDASLMVSHLKLHLDRLCRMQQRFFCATTQGMNEVETTKDPSDPVEETTTKTVTEDNADPWTLTVKLESSHRDGIIYKTRKAWQNAYSVDFADRAETGLLVDDPRQYGYSLTCEMMQVFWFKIAAVLHTTGPVQLYGYIAARDEVDLKLSYLFHRSRDDPFILRQGDLIPMTGPKRGIALFYDVFLEFDVRIKNGEKEEDDLQLIDGLSEFDGMHMPSFTPYKVCIHGDCGAVDMCLSLIQKAVQAAVEVVISQVHSGFELSLSSVLNVKEVHEEVQLFSGAIGEPCRLRRFVIAVNTDTVMRLKFKMGGG